MLDGIEPKNLNRRKLLLSSAGFLSVSACSASKTVTAQSDQSWRADPGSPPDTANAGAWRFFTPEEGAAVEALADRLIPPDPTTPGGREAGVAVFIDRQLAGPYGTSQALYMRPPFMDGTPTQGNQSPLTPAQRYRASLAALDRHCRAAFAGKAFHDIPDDRKDELVTAMERNAPLLEGLSSKGFFDQLLRNTQEGFFADPVYGGNRDLVAWKMIGFPGARYDYRDWVGRHNERYPLPPVGITGRDGAPV